MSDREKYMMLINAMNRIENSLKQINYEFSSHFLPGLTSEVIHLLTRSLPFHLPNEILELYQWRNGCVKNLNSIVFPSGQYLPLQDAIVKYREIIEAFGSNDAILYKGDPLFPFCEMDGRYCAVVVSYQAHQKNPIVFINDVYDVFIEFSSLTDMMLAIAECYETKAYLMKDGFLDFEENKFIGIYRKYNQEIIKEALNNISVSNKKSLELLTEDEVEELYTSLSIVKKFREPRSLVILLDFLKKHSLPIRDPAKDFIRAGAINAISTLRDQRAFEALLLALNDESELVRDFAASGLGMLEDKRAIDPLFSILQDSSEEVRRSATRALVCLHAINIILPALEHSNPHVRISGINIVQQLKLVKLSHFLQSLTSDDNFEVRRNAERVLNYFQREGLI